MKKDRITYLQNILFPCVVFSLVTGAVTGGIIFLFRFCASRVGEWSSAVYDLARQKPLWLLALLGAAACLGLLSYIFTKFIPDCQGGGIPTAIGLVRGVLSFRWLTCLLGVFFSSLITYLGGIPLGTEGPSVQMGTAVGKGTVRLLGRRHLAWDRYVMTGGAGAGFAAATGAPLTGILFAFEEAHERFSPMLLMVSAMTVASGSLTAEFLFSLTGDSWKMFSFPSAPSLPLSYFWIPLVIGIVCGLFAVLFTKGYDLLGDFLQKVKIPSAVKILSVFLLTVFGGFFLKDSVGSGHHLISDLMTPHGVGISLLILLIVRAILLILANRVGITGGLFVPSLAFGALLGALCGNGLVFAGILPEEYFPVTVIVGMCAFLGASSRTPLMAIAFSLEALSGIENILPVVLGVCFAFVVIELFGMEGFVEAVLEKKVEARTEGKTPVTMDEKYTVCPNSFVIGKSVRDILWPPRCQVLSIDKSHAAAHGGATLSRGDVLHLHYQTYDLFRTQEEIKALLGDGQEQENEKPS